MCCSEPHLEHLGRALIKAETSIIMSCLCQNSLTYCLYCYGKCATGMTSQLWSHYPGNTHTHTHLRDTEVISVIVTFGLHTHTHRQSMTRVTDCGLHSASAKASTMPGISPVCVWKHDRFPKQDNRKFNHRCHVKTTYSS